MKLPCNLTTVFQLLTQHASRGTTSVAFQIGLMSFWLHDEMIAVDLLESLPHVDEKNLGVVGCSGGGTQSSYLGAMDSRIKAASMACTGPDAHFKPTLPDRISGLLCTGSLVRATALCATFLRLHQHQGGRHALYVACRRTTAPCPQCEEPVPRERDADGHLMGILMLALRVGTPGMQGTPAAVAMASRRGRTGSRTGQ